ncbi:elongation factor EF-2 [Fervidicoccus fontis]|uniref:Elongation factor 2 n=1 Tax=Fervidicoccus fontis (strain DSM 19380 / JCM 18336 / VKM B-2539 / Kam940) TaxID=1163730 RepID=I0A2X8_FERFK|nr:elongation factor EF-2 [Fervidicoccus fontis]AFH43335.1 elongation factor EF-2 [Fervidicoccus fontis Kam940]
MVKYKMVPEILKMMGNLDQVRNIGIIAHVDHGKTTTSDTLLAAAGIISQKVAGEALATDYLEVEQKRGITVKAANVSLYHEVDGKSYVINLIDTPGHVDFTGKVTRSLRVLDGAIVVVDAVEGIMTQTETVLRQALEERVRPLLFINKVDRLIKELKYTPQQMQQRFVEIIKDINKLIMNQAEPEFRDKWLLDPAKGQVAFGSAKEKWGFTIPVSAKKGINLSHVIDAYNKGKEAIEELAKEVPIANSLLDMVIKYVPNPREAQKYRIPKIWKGDINSTIGKAMLEADPNGPAVMLINDMRVDPHAGLVATGRLFSGYLESGKEVWLVNSKVPQKILQVSLYMGPTREVADRVVAGNILAVLGLDKARAGETVVDVAYKDEMAPFERLHYVSEPVVTVAVEPKNTKDLPKLIESLYRLSIEDPNLVVKINEETGEYLLSGMGPLHLEIAMTFLKDNYGVEVTTSPPVIVYRESIRTTSDVFEGKSPNKHNKFYISVEPLNEETIKLIQEGQVFNDQDFRDRAKILRDKAGWDYDEARKIWLVEDNINIFVDKTSGLQYLREVKDTILQAFRLAMKEGPLANEPVRGVKVVLHDAVIHEDPAHRGPAQIYPAVRNAIFAGMLSAKPTLLEPIQKLDIRLPMDYLSGVTAIITKKRGKILTVAEAGDLTRVIAEIPVAESFDLASELRSVTAGKAFWGLEFSRWSPVPDSLLMDVVKKIRERKGLPLEPPKVSDFLSP